MVMEINIGGMPRKIELKDEERQECEIWTRVMGYYRPVSEFNIGKKGEHFDRTFFNAYIALNSMKHIDIGAD
jgi:hypothetical protein